MKTQSNYGSLIHNWQNLEVTKMSFGINRLQYIQTIKYYLDLNRNELSHHQKTWKNFI